MGLNAQTSVPAFTTGQVLTAQQQTDINTGIPVFATTVTRDAAFGGTGEKTLAEGQFAYIEATKTTQYYDGAAWQPVGTTPGMVFITGAAFSAQSSVGMAAGTFTSTYKNYQVELVVTSCSAQLQILPRVNAAGVSQSGANYFWGTGIMNTGGAFTGTGAGSSTSPQLMGTDATRGTMGNIMVFDPLNASSYTHVTAQSMGNIGGVSGSIYSGYFYNATAAHDGLTFVTSTGNMTGYYRVYGLSES
jgi:hypothetical protein